MSDTPPKSEPVGFRKIARGVAWNWGEFVITGALAFFVSPFVVRHLGPNAYGVWILVNSMVSFLVILDLGIRGAVVRFVSADHARGQHEEASRAVSAALWFRLWLGSMVLLLAVVLSILAPRLFNIPTEMHTAARVAIVLSGTNFALALVYGVFSGVLNALHRFDLISAATIGYGILNAAGLLFLLGGGHGIIAMASWQLFVGALMGAFLYWGARHAYPDLQLMFRAPERALIYKLGSYSLFLFLNVIAGQVIYYTDNVVIGAALPISAVTLYALGFAPTQYLRQIISAVAVTFLPAASNLGARGEYAQLRRLLIHGTRLVMAIALALEIGLFFRGKTFIGLWMGAEYGIPSGQVLQVLTFSWLFISGNACAYNLAYGLSKHRPIAIWTMCEAIVNLALSVFLVRRMGILGVAWGTAMPSLVINAIVWPRYIARILDIPLMHYLYQSWVRPAVAMLPFALACYLAERWWQVHHLVGFFLQMAALMPIALAGMALMFHREVFTLARERGWFPARIPPRPR